MRLLVNPHIAFDPTPYRPKLLALAALSSFISATWVASNPRSIYKSQWWWYDGWFYTIPIAILSYLVFFLIFVTKVVLEWRLEILVPKRVEVACIGLAWCAQLVVFVLENVANPNGGIWSSWGAVSTMSFISLFALTIHLLLPIFPDIWRILVIIVLPQRLRSPNSLDTFSEEPLLPAYTTQPTENLEAQVRDGGVTGPEILIDFDSGVIQNHSGDSKEPWKGEDVTRPGDGLERREVGASSQA